MAPPAIIVVVTVALGSLLALALVTWSLVRRVRELTARLSTVQDRLDPQLRTLSHATEVTQQELERLADRDARGPRHPVPPRV